MKKGTVVLVPFPFTNLKGSKRRTAVTISNSERRGDDVILAFVSSKDLNRLEETDYVVKESHPDFLDTGLKKSSVFKMDKLVTLEKRIIIGRLGNVSKSILEELDKRLKIALDL